MRTIERSSAFRRDYKRESKSRHRATLDADLVPLLIALADDQALELRHSDHELSGDWGGYRECHIRPDLLLIYRKTEDWMLRLARLGSHSELFGLRRSVNSLRYRLAAIICDACCRLVSVTVAPLSILATSCVLAR